MHPVSSPHFRRRPHLLFPSEAAPSNAPRAPSSPRLLSGIVPFPLFGTAPLPPVSSLFPPSQASFLYSPARALLAPPSSLAPALSRRLFDSQHWLFRPLAPSFLSAPFDQTGLNGRPSFGQIWLNEGPFRTKVLCSAIFSLTEALGSAKQDRIEALRSVLFGRTVLKGRGCWGPVMKSRRGVSGESMCQKVKGGF